MANNAINQRSCLLDHAPAGYADGANLYAYCGARPTAAVDPFGLEGALEWHHLVPDAVAKKLAPYVEGGMGFIDDAAHGWIMTGTDHRILHEAGWSEDWSRWARQRIGALRGTNKLSRAEVLAAMRDFRSLDKYQPILRTGFPTKMSYSQWGSFKANKILNKLKSTQVTKFFDDIASLGYERLRDRYKKKLAAKAARKAGKAVPIMNLALAAVAFAGRVANGENIVVAAAKEGAELAPGIGPAVALGNLINDCIAEEAQDRVDTFHNLVVRALHNQRPLPEPLRRPGLIVNNGTRTPEEYYNSIIADVLRTMPPSQYLADFGHWERWGMELAWERLRREWVDEYMILPGRAADKNGNPVNAFPLLPKNLPME